MRRASKIALWVLGVLIALPLLAVIGVLIFANTGAGQHLIETQAGSLTGGMVQLSGFSGRFPDDLHIGHLEVRDRGGAWMTADNLALDWSPTALLGLTARINNLSATTLTVTRLPLPSTAPAAPSSAAPFKLPVSVDVRRLAVARLALGEKVAGAAAVLKIDGVASVPYSWAGTATIDATRLDSPGAYHIQASLTPQSITADITAQEPQGGLIASLAKLPALGPVAAKIVVGGPQSAERAQIAITAGPLHLNIAGTVDIPGQAAALDVVAGAPAMRPRADIAWQGIAINGHVKGKFTAPDATAAITVTGLEAGGAKLDALRADVAGTRGRVDLHAVLTGTHLPGAQQDLFASAPIDLTGTVDLQAPHRPAQFHVTHPLLSLTGDAQTAGDIAANVTLAVPDIAPFAATEGEDLHGRLATTAHLNQHGGVSDITADGQTDLTSGQAPAPALLGLTKFNAVASAQGGNVTVKTVTLNGRELHLDLTGALQNQELDFKWNVGLPDLAALSPQARGALTATGHFGGKLDAISVDATVTGDAGSDQFAKAPVDIKLHANGLPKAPNADLRAALQFSGSPLTVLAQVTTASNGTLHTVLQRADWKSVAATADLSLRKGADVPVGRFDLSVRQLGDFSALAHTDLSGSLKAALVSAPAAATVDVQGKDLANGARRIASLTLAGRAAGDLKDPDLTAALTLDGINAQGATGQARVTLRGRQTALNIGANAQLQNLRGANANVALAALLNGKTRQVTLHNVTGNWQTLALRQQGAALIDFGEKIAVDHLHLTLNQATLSVAGRVSPTMDLTASLHNLTPDLAKPFAPTLAASGTVSADAHLTGTPAAPRGRVHLAASGLRMRNGPGASLPPTSANAQADLNGQSAHIDLRVNAGKRLTLAVIGTAPLQPTGPLALQTTGQLDLALLAPILEAGGRRANGEASLNIATAGTLRSPSVSGSITLANGEFQDFTQGVQLSKIAARIDANGDTLTITRFHATAGQGDIQVAGSVGALAPGLPVDLHITAHQARPLSSDLLTATLDADISVKGQAAGEMDAAGKVLLHKVEINIPDSLPPSVATLNVQRAGYKPPPPPAVAPRVSVVKLNIIVDAPCCIFVRGKGLDAEMGGRLTIAGTSARPDVGGGFQMRHGEFSLAGTTLTFTKGDVSFNGASSVGKIDPTLDFEADNQTSTVTAMLKVTGYADAPKITLSAIPELPQDEVLSQLLFGQSMKQLTPFQIAEIGAALAELSGVTGSGGPLGSIRKGLGLDRLSVGGGSNGSGPSVEAGRYVAKGVYVGAKQSTGGAGGTQALVQIDITRRLKLNTTLGTGGGSVQGATPQNDPGSSVGLSYTFEY
jgi:translocation and assembly module TamB